MNQYYYSGGLVRGIDRAGESIAAGLLRRTELAREEAERQRVEAEKQKAFDNALEAYKNLTGGGGPGTRGIAQFGVRPIEDTAGRRLLMGGGANAPSAYNPNFNPPVTSGMASRVEPVESGSQPQIPYTSSENYNTNLSTAYNQIKTPKASGYFEKMLNNYQIPPTQYELLRQGRETEIYNTNLKEKEQEGKIKDLTNALILGDEKVDEETIRVAIESGIPQAWINSAIVAAEKHVAEQARINRSNQLTQPKQPTKQSTQPKQPTISDTQIVDGYDGTWKELNKRIEQIEGNDEGSLIVAQTRFDELKEKGTWGIGKASSEELTAAGKAVADLTTELERLNALRKAHINRVKSRGKSETGKPDFWDSE